MDTALVLMIQEVIDLIVERINKLSIHLLALKNEFGKTPCMAHTRGQQAVPVTLEVKINAWLHPLQRQLERIAEIKKRVLVVQLGGAAGTLAVYPDKATQ